MMLWVVLAMLVAFLSYMVWTICYEVPYNIDAINKDGSNDSLKKGFHSRRMWVRILVAAPLCLGVAVVTGYALGWGKAGWAFAAILVALAGFFARTFGPMLNVGLLLPYKHRFYASPVSKSTPDRQIWAWVRHRNPGTPDLALQDAADSLNHTLLNVVGGICLVAFLYLTYRTFV